MIGSRESAVALALASCVACASCAGGGQGESRSEAGGASQASVGDSTEATMATTEGAPTTDGSAAMTTGATGTASPSSSGAGTDSDATTGAVLSTGDSGSSGEDSSTGVAAGCGDGVTVDPELCDDGNAVDGDGCNGDCTPSGRLLWSTLQGGGVGLTDEGIGCAVDSTGAIVVTGYLSVVKGDDDLWVRKYSFGGAPLWTKTIAGTGMLPDQGRAVVIDAAQEAYVAGVVNTAGQDNDGHVIKYAADGAALWTASFSGAALLADAASAAALTLDGNVLMAGSTTVVGEAGNSWLRKYTPAGKVLWTRGHNGAANASDAIHALTVTSEGDIYAAGSEGVAGEGANIWLAKYDVDGNELWSRLYAGAGGKNDYLHAAVALADGSVVVCGYESALEIPWMSFMRRYDTAGKIVWTEIDSGPEMLGALCYGLDLAANGDILMTGAAIEGGEREPRVRRVTAEGVAVWSTIAAGAGKGASQGRCVKEAPDGTIVVSGSLDDGVDGRDIWVARFSP